MKFVDFKIDPYVSEEVKGVIEMLKSVLKDGRANKKFAPLKNVMTSYSEVLSSINVSIVNATHKYIKTKELDDAESVRKLLDRIFGAAVIVYDIGVPKEEKKEDEEDGA